MVTESMYTLCSIVFFTIIDYILESVIFTAEYTLIYFNYCDRHQL